MDQGFYTGYFKLDYIADDNEPFKGFSDEVVDEFENFSDEENELAENIIVILKPRFS